MKYLIRNKHFYLMLLIDAAFVTAAYILAYILRFEGSIPQYQVLNLQKTLPFLIPIKLIVFYFFQMYKGMWRYTSILDLKNVFLASTASSIILLMTTIYAYQFLGFSRSIFIIDWGLTIFFVGGIRIGIRLALTNHASSLWTISPYRKSWDSSAKRLLIIGAGGAGEKVLRELLDNPGVHLNPVGFLDDAGEKLGKSIHGVPVVGSVEQIDEVPLEYDEILIAIPSARGEQMRRIIDACERTGKKFRTVPSMGELIEGKISVNAIREVTLEDLVGRDEVRLDQEKISQFLSQKRILVTGAGGSIGSELVRQISRFNPRSIALMDFSEFNLFKIEMECRQRFPHLEICPCLGDIRDPETVNSLFSKFSPQVVFHAAAYKHVPIQEVHPREACMANVLGTKNLVEASLKTGVDRFVLVSTDKAVRPANVMGATKRLAEMFVDSMNGKTNTRFLSVRFGNVIRSSGSVIPLFQDQIARGGPVTVTHREITRYFMTIPEAAQLILQAGAMGEGGEIFILEMGKPIRILDMARDLIRLHGYVPEKDIPIQFIGLRPGEKLFEELITEGEGIVSTSHEKIMVLRGNSHEYGPLISGIEELLGITSGGSEMDIKKKLKELVPEYESAPGESASP
jgi:FlaA1/EpsC-like NDP-sugar epimerase